MPKQLLSGTIDEQCAALYAIAVQKMEQGSYTGAVHALREILKHRPEYPEAAALLGEAKRRQKETRTLLIWSMVGLAFFVGLGSYWNVRSDLYLMALGAAGMVVGYAVGNLINSYRRPKSA